MRGSPNRLVATVFGAVYLVVGLLGAFISGGVGFVSNQGVLLLGVFMVNPLHNVAHILIGAALLLAGVSSTAAAKTVNSTIGAVYLLLGIVGFFVHGAINVLALNTPDQFLHLGSAVVLLGTGLAADHSVRRTSATV